MFRSLFRIGVISAAVVVGGTVFAAANATDTPVGALAATQATDDDYCLLVGGVWYCYEV